MPSGPVRRPRHELAFAAAIRAARVEAGRTQADVAAGDGLPVRPVQRAEQGRRRVTLGDGAPSLSRSDVHSTSWWLCQRRRRSSRRRLLGHGGLTDPDLLWTRLATWGSLKSIGRRRARLCGAVSPANTRPQVLSMEDGYYIGQRIASRILLRWPGPRCRRRAARPVAQPAVATRRATGSHRAPRSQRSPRSEQRSGPVALL
jgi:hypothetical protein